MTFNNCQRFIFVILYNTTIFFSHVVHGAEGGSGLYVPGFISPQAGYMPDPGTYSGYNFYFYKGDASAYTSKSIKVPIPGTDFQLPVQAGVKGRAKLDVDLYAHIFSITHVFTNELLGGKPGFSLLLPYISANLDTTASGIATLTGPRGNNFIIPISGKASYRDNGIGDIGLTCLVGWHKQSMHYMTILNVYAPTGKWNKNNVVNTGKNHWAIEPMGAITYLNEVNGREISSAAGVTFNKSNTATKYKTGNEFHIDLVAVQHFSKQFYLGLTSYAYYQLTGDSGSGATSGFKGRVFAIGPVVGTMIPIGQNNNLYINMRYYNESRVKNRLDGNALFLTATVNI